MAKAIGEFSLKHSGSGYAKTDDGLTAYSNWEGTATDFGAVFGSLSVPLSMSDEDPSSGPCSWAGQAFLEDGSGVIGTGEGTWKKADGAHAWSISMVLEISNGTKLKSEGHIDLASLTYKGEMFEA